MEESLRKFIKIESKKSDRKVSSNLLQEAFLMNPIKDYSPWQIMPILLYWGEKRRLIDFINFDGDILGKRTADNLRSELHTSLFSVHLLDLIGAPYSIEHTEYKKNKDSPLHIKQKILIGEREHVKDNLHLELGLNYCYPSCCIYGFINQTNDRTFHTTNTKERLNDPSILNYILHVPCSFDCQETRKLAKVYQDFVRKDYPILSEIIENF